MDEEARIREDIALIEKSIAELGSAAPRGILDAALRYKRDAEYYLSKRDYVTAFGCINYAHGLLDAVKMAVK